MKLVKITLTLGRTRDAPNGDPRHGYEFIAPLNSQGHLDASGWPHVKDRCTVRSFRPGREDRVGHLRQAGRGWRFDFESDRPEGDDQEPLFHLDKHLIARGLYLTVAEENGLQQPFRIAAITPVMEAA